jgi:cyclic pyranopterin monophosphate synthase
MSKKLSHINAVGIPDMVDVGSKESTSRKAVAEARLWMPKEIVSVLKKSDFMLAKGPIIQTAVLAGIMAAKKTSDLIPLCHPLSLDKVGLDIKFVKDTMIIRCEASIHSKTGVEMEALTGASIAALTIYDMCKGISHEMEIQSIKLVSKIGGKRNIG